jgi:uncharacterized membrane protein
VAGRTPTQPPRLLLVRYEATIDVAAPARQVFDVYADVERWPDWTASVTSIERLDEGPLRVGSRARVRQPWLPTTVWEVTELVPGERFSWVARGPGVVTTGIHIARDTDRAGVTEVTAALEQGGPLGAVLGLLSRRLTRRYLDLEVRGIKQRCEA